MSVLTPAVAAGCMAIAAALAGRPRRGGTDRLAVVLRAPPVSVETGRPPQVATSVRSRRSLARLATAAVVLVAGVVTVGGLLGLVAGLGAGVAVVVLRPAPDGPGIDPDEVAVVVDLMAGCLGAGTGLPAALDAAAIAAGDDLRRRCQAVATALRAGVPADEAWLSWLADPWLAPVGRTAVRTSHTGAAAAAELRRTSMRLRARRRSAAQHKVRRASVWLVVPLGLCFLPAFVLVAVVPLVVGLLPSLR